MQLAKGIENKVEFTLKAKNSVDPITIDPADTFTFKVIDSKDDSIILTCDSAEGSIELTDMPNGLITVIVNETKANDLKFKIRETVDKHAPMIVYYAILDCNTNELGKLRVHIPEVEVISNGTA